MVLPATASATAPWSGSFGPVPDATATPAPPPQSQVVSIPYAGRSTREHACRGRVALSLKRGAALLQRRTVRFTRRCRFNATFHVTREQIGDATQLVVVQRLSGRRKAATVRVPSAESALLGSRGSEQHQAPEALEMLEPFRPPELVPG